MNGSILLAEAGGGGPVLRSTITWHAALVAIAMAVPGQVLGAGTAEGGPVQEIARTFGVDWAHLIAQIISFGIVCILLHRYAYRPVLAMLAARREEIAQGLANAEKIKAELAKTEAQRQEVMAQANAQATKLIEEARAAAARVQEQETQKAIAAAEQINPKPREAAAQEHERP